MVKLYGKTLLIPTARSPFESTLPPKELSAAPTNRYLPVTYNIYNLQQAIAELVVR